MEYSSNGKGNLGVTLGAIGTGLGILGGGANLLNWGNNNSEDKMVTRYELDMAQKLSSKDSEIALLKSESVAEQKMIDVYERLSARILANERSQSDVNSAQAVYNANANSAIAVLQNQVGVLNSLTKTVVPIGSVCPQPMPQYNSWKEPV